MAYKDTVHTFSHYVYTSYHHYLRGEGTFTNCIYGYYARKSTQNGPPGTFTPPVLPCLAPCLFTPSPLRRGISLAQVFGVWDMA